MINKIINNRLKFARIITGVVITSLIYTTVYAVNYETNNPKYIDELTAIPISIPTPKPTPKPCPIQTSITEASKKYNVENELIKAIITHESNFDQSVISTAGAIGLMQLMPDTAKWLNVDPYNAKENIMGGTRYIGLLLKQYKRLDLALACYNAGEGNVNKYNGIPPFKETQNYVRNVTNTYNKLKGGNGNEN
jgi:soluble lytic murein transglycosylase-like protein